MASAVALALAALLVVVAAPAGAVQIPGTSAAGFPNERTSNDPPGNAIDNNTSTYTWTTESLNTASPSYLAIGFASSPVNRLRILKTPESGGGTGSGVKNLVIQYATGTGPLASRSWANVPNLVNGNLFAGYFGSEPLSAGSVNADGTVLGDAHNGFASLTFDTVQATGLRIGFSVIGGGACSSNPNAPCNHYRVGEFQAHFEQAGAPGAPGASSGVRVSSIEGTGVRLRVTFPDGRVEFARPGDVLPPGAQLEVLGGPEAEVTVNQLDNENTVTVSGWEGVPCSNDNQVQFEGRIEDADGSPATQGSAMSNQCGELLQNTASQIQSVHQAAGAFALTPEASVQASGRARLVREPRRGRTTVSSLRGAVQVRPTNPALRGLRLVPGQAVRVTRAAIGTPFALVPDLRNEIPSPRRVRAGPALVTAPGRLSLRSLRRSKCVRVAVASSRPARVLVTIFSGRRSVRLFGQRLVTFAAPGRTIICILVPRRARTFNVRTPLSFAVGYALGARARAGQRSTRPVIRPIALVP